MNRKLAAIGSAAVLCLLALPMHAGAVTPLGGYNATAQAAVVRVEVFEPALPIPASPQGDVGIGFTRSTTLTGPASRALSSYLWPSDAIGDGLPTLTGTSLDYPLKVNSRYPPTSAAPATNAAQVSDGNGMMTSASASKVVANVTGVGVAGTNALSGAGAGLCDLFGKTCPSLPTVPVPVSVSSALAGAATMSNLSSQTTVDLSSSQVSALAHASASNLSLLGGLITMNGVDITTSSVSGAAHSAVTGTLAITGLKIAGQTIDIARKIRLGGTEQALPDLPEPLSSIGVSVNYLQTQSAARRTSGMLDAQGLVITVDTKPLVTALHLSTVTGPLGNLLAQIPTIGTQLGPLLGISPKIVIIVGDAEASTSATAGYSGSTYPTPGSTTPSSGVVTGPGESSVPPLGPSVGDGATGGPAPEVAGRPAAAVLPGLGGLPSGVILGGLVLALVVGWVLRAVGAPVVGAAASCSLGLATGVPDLRKE